MDSVLKALYPTKTENVIDVVEACGHDITPWGVNQDGSVVKNPSTNQNRVHNWAFEYPGQLSLVLLWHKKMRVTEAGITYTIAPWDEFHRYKAEGAPKRAQSAKKLAAILFQAHREEQNLYVAIVAPDPRKSEDATDSVKYRQLDNELWHVGRFDQDSMEFDIVRGPRKVEDSVKQLVLPAPTEETYSVGVVDQFIGSDRPDTYEINGKVCRRDPKVRQAVMQRSNGACEHCGQKGFKTIGGEYYLESHHVNPLSEGGPDLESNVMALCPAHHREAHFGMERDRLRELLLEGLAKMGY